MKPLMNNWRIRNRGAILLEFALVAFIFFLTAVTVIDFTRYMAVEGILIKGAERGLNVAVKVPDFDIDTHTLNLSDEEDERLYQDFIQAQNTIINEALQLPLASFVTSSAGSETGLHRLTPFVIERQDGTRQRVDAIVLRPGESFSSADGSYTIVHPGRAAPLRSSEKHTVEMQKHPLVVQLRVTIQSVIFGTLTAKGTAMGYRELPLAGTYPLPASPPRLTSTTTSTMSTTTTTASVTTVSISTTISTTTSTVTTTSTMTTTLTTATTSVVTSTIGTSTVITTSTTSVPTTSTTTLSVSTTTSIPTSITTSTVEPCHPPSWRQCHREGHRTGQTLCPNRETCRCVPCRGSS